MVLEVSVRTHLLVILMVLGLALPSVSDATAGSRRDEMVWGAIGTPETLNPLFSGLSWHVLYMTDVVYDDVSRLSPRGVESLPSLKDGTWRVEGEAMALTWTLRRRAWHDGVPVTCGDYVFTFTVVRDARVPVPFDRYEAAREGLISSVQCPKGQDAREVVVRWAVRSPRAVLGIIGGPVLPRHVVERYYRSNPGRLHQTPYGIDIGLTVGDGPYRVVEFRRQQVVAFEAVRGHPVLGTPRIRRHVLRVYPVGPAGFGGLRVVEATLAGEVDVAGNFNVAGLREFKQRGEGSVRFVVVPTMNFEHIDFNLENPLLKDVRVRKAIAHAINRPAAWEEFAEVVPGAFTLAHTYLPRQHPGYPVDVATYAYDPARARRLLKEAGFTPGPDGILRTAAGERLTLDLATREDQSTRRLAIRAIQRQLREVGIEIAIVEVPARVLFDELLQRRRYRAMALYAWVLDPLSDCEGLYTSGGIPSEQNGWVGRNYPGYRNEEMDRLCKEAARELDFGKRSALLQQTARIFARDLPALPLLFPAAVHVIRVGLENYRPSFSGITWNVHEWYWK